MRDAPTPRRAPSRPHGTSTGGSSWIAHLSTACLFAGLSAWLSWPLASRMSTHLAGSGLGDNVVFLWNAWWMRRALASGAIDFLRTDAQFFPGGVDLVLHTHTAINAWLAATAFGRLPLAAALNATVLLNGALNGFAAYLLAWRTTGHRLGSITAGVFFAASPPLTATLAGHFNHHTAWGLPLFAYAWLQALDRRSVPWAAAAGLVLAAVAYSDYYYFVYACALAACVLAFRWLRPGVSRSGWLPPAGFDRALLVIGLAALTLAVMVAATGGFVIDLFSAPVSLRTGTNVRALAMLCLMVWGWRRFRPALSWRPHAELIGGDTRIAAAAAVVSCVLILPLLTHAAALWRAGEYVTQTYYWRSAPSGVDAASLVLGNPFNGLWGGAVTHLYGALGMSPYAGPLWMGVVPVVLVATRRRWGRLDDAGLWLLVMGVFLLWAIGPYLVVFGINTGLPMPQTLLRFLPVVSNARVPSHATVVVHLSGAVLLAMAMSTLAPARRRLHAGALLAVTLVDFSPAPVSTARLEASDVYRRLAALPPGGVLEVPFGVRDGFGERGLMDVATLYHQTVHEHPLASGYISRVPPGVWARYEAAPFPELLMLSAGSAVREPLPPSAGRDAVERLRELGIAYVVVNTAAASAPLSSFVRMMPLGLIAEADGRELYEVPR